MIVLAFEYYKKQLSNELYNYLNIKSFHYEMNTRFIFQICYTETIFLERSKNKVYFVLLLKY